jgi:hypothetical protein
MAVTDIEETLIEGLDLRVESDAGALLPCDPVHASTI